MTSVSMTASPRTADCQKKNQALSQFVLTVALAFAVLAAPAIVYPYFAIKVMCFALFAAAFNLLIGYTGLLSFGHAAFFGMGSYVCAWVMKKYGLSAEIALLAGGLVGGALGLVFGWLAIRRQGVYFAMITLALAQMVYFFCLEAPFTGGEDGIQNVPRGALFGTFALRSDLAIYYFVAVFFFCGYLFANRISRSPFGFVLRGIMDNEARVISLGFRASSYKIIAFALSAAIAGIAGGLKALSFGVATLADVNITTSASVIMMVLLGGIGTIYGPLIGALVVVSMDTFLAPFGAWVTVIQGALFVLVILVFRKGVVGEINSKLKLSL